MLTGRYYFKQTILGLVLMLEIEELRTGDPEDGYFLTWVKGTPSDLVDLNVQVGKI